MLFTTYEINQTFTDVHAHLNGNKADPKPMFTLIPMTLNPHIRKLFVRNTSLGRLDATLKFYPHLEEVRLEGNQIKVSHSRRFVINRYRTTLKLLQNDN